MFIGADQLCPFRAPLGGDVSLAHHTFGLDLKDVGEIGPQRNFEENRIRRML